MKAIVNTLFWTCLVKIAVCQNNEVRLHEYLYPRTNPMTFNCSYTSSNGEELHEIISLTFKTIRLKNEIAYCVSQIKDKDCSRSEVATFLGSAMLFRNDSILLAPLELFNSPSNLKLKDFKYVIPPTLKPGGSITIQSYYRKITLCEFEFDTLTINNKHFEDCLRIKVAEIYKDKVEPSYGYVWLNKTYGIIKWIRVTKRTEIRVLPDK